MHFFLEFSKILFSCLLSHNKEELPTFNRNYVAYRGPKYLLYDLLQKKCSDLYSTGVENVHILISFWSQLYQWSFMVRATV